MLPRLVGVAKAIELETRGLLKRPHHLHATRCARARPTLRGRASARIGGRPGQQRCLARVDRGGRSADGHGRVRNRRDPDLAIIERGIVLGHSVGVAEIQGVGRDVTARRQMERDLQASEQRLRLAIDSIPDAFALYDAEDRPVRQVGHAAVGAADDGPAGALVDGEVKVLRTVGRGHS